ncbi:hypothetical protein IKO18_03410 [bacterium]|jgi:hypothetical protein|nr:hypothetical protein [bacterium]
MKELDELYASETANEKDKKKLAEAKKLYDENKASLEAEIQRIRGLVADLKF